MTPARLAAWIGGELCVIACLALIACGGTNKYEGDGEDAEEVPGDGVEMDVVADGEDASDILEERDGPCTCTESEECDDGLACNGEETCDGCYCWPGTAVDCRDDVDCTVDECVEPDATCQNIPDSRLCGPDEICDPSEGCIPAPECSEDADCQDGFYCNGEETCGESGLCEGGTPIDCNDTYACTVDACDEDADDCSYTPVDLSCGDGLWCSIDVCDPTSTDPSPDSYGCIHTARDCADSVACTTDSCNDDTDSCDHTADHTACSDGLFCTDDVCDPTSGCSNPALDCTDSVSCTTDTCNEETDACDHTPDDTACSDGLFCTDDVCDVSTGCSNPAHDCSDTVSCTTDSCNEDTDSCDHTPDDTACSDGLFCTDDVCDVSTGCSNPAHDCSDAHSCTTDSCNEETDSCDHTPDNSACADGLFCTDDVCDVSTGCSNPARDCSDTWYCTVDSCTESGGGSCVNTPDDGLCDDSLRCTNENCNPSSGMADSQGCVRSAVICAADGLTCTDDSCSEIGSDPCPYTLIAGNCLIPDGGGTPTCYADDDPNPSNQCEFCDSTTSTTTWTARPFGYRCDDGVGMTVLDHCDSTPTCVGCHREITPPGGTGTIPECSDGWDNNGNGIIDWADDPTCINMTSTETGMVAMPTFCTNTVDDDSDSTVDFGADSGCHMNIDDHEDRAHPACNDGIDNDGDTLTDFPDDPGCQLLRDLDETDPGGSFDTACSDMIDNDGDTLVDFSPSGLTPDPGCTSAMDNSEFNCDVDPMCSDGVDNDSDTLTDYPNDPGCFSLRDDDETDHSGVATECSDGIDNDSDTLADGADSDCASSTDNAEHV